ncbi:MAG TPA: bifunctional phosphoribosylaminoimidazolecarboxamide formyltransferase/IMP cyclohydrolase, partial [Candidatus Polarisedimenticolia bacterium]|nr:bifunctional phosphoribosylaminoimidazolecarboxamide formyltransferase/IMP cyclohydrolase [Candidatus Polarisedimenticolia bacterium]
MHVKKRALISVYDKAGVVDLARELAGLGHTLLSTGGTAEALRNAGLPVVEISHYTGHPE